MIKKISLLVVLFIVQISFAQKAQKVGYVDRTFILENIPEYVTAQSKLDKKIQTWNAKLDKQKNEIEAMKLSLSNEKALLTSDLIAERQEDIEIKQTEHKKLKEAYFGVSGDLFLLKKQLVKPIQDQIFNAIQEISVSKKYDIIFDKSSNDMVMLYNNPKYDVSELVLRKIVKGRKVKENAKKKSDKEKAREDKKAKVKTKINERLSKQEQLKERIRIRKEEAAAKREALKKAQAEKREKKRAAILAKRNERLNKGKKPAEVKETKEESKPTTEGIKEEVETKKESNKSDIETTVEKTEEATSPAKTKEALRAEKRQLLLDRAANKKAKRDSLRQVAKDKRAAKLAEIAARKKKLQEANNNKNN